MNIYTKTELWNESIAIEIGGICTFITLGIFLYNLIFSRYESELNPYFICSMFKNIKHGSGHEMQLFNFIVVYFPFQILIRILRLKRFLTSPRNFPRQARCST